MECLCCGSSLLRPPRPLPLRLRPLPRPPLPRPLYPPRPRPLPPLLLPPPPRPSPRPDILLIWFVGSCYCLSQLLWFYYQCILRMVIDLRMRIGWWPVASGVASTRYVPRGSSTLLFMYTIIHYLLFGHINLVDILTKFSLSHKHTIIISSYHISGKRID